MNVNRLRYAIVGISYYRQFLAAFGGRLLGLEGDSFLFGVGPLEAIVYQNSFSLYDEFIEKVHDARRSTYSVDFNINTKASFISLGALITWPFLITSDLPLVALSTCFDVARSAIRSFR